MANSYVFYPSETGSTTDYSVPFEYLSQGFVKATVNGVSAPFTFLSTYMIRFSVAPVGALKIYRQTNKAPINTFYNGSILVDDELNGSFLQSLHVSEEVAENAMQTASDGAWDATNLRIKNVANPVNANDAVNKGWYDVTIDADKAYIDAAKATVAADKAIVAADKGIVAADKATVAADKATTVDAKDDALAAAIAAANSAYEASTYVGGASSLNGQPGSYYLSRANHTGSQAISTVTGLQTALDGKASTAVATTSVNGLMAAADKVKLNAVGTMANRAVTISTAAPSGGSDGDVWLQV